MMILLELRTMVITLTKKEGVMELKIGTPVVASSFSQKKMLGAIISMTPYAKDSLGAYKIEWSDGYTAWYSHAETSGYAQKAQRILEA